MAALIPMSGTVTHVNDKGFQVEEQPGIWFNISKFMDPKPALPAVGQRVRATVDDNHWIKSLEVGYDPAVPGVPTSPSAGPTAPGAVLATRIACLQAAAAYLAPRTEAKAADVVKVAQAFEEWVTR